MSVSRKPVQSYTTKQLFARVQALSDEHHVPLIYFSYFLDIGVDHIYDHLQGVPKWTPSEKWIAKAEITLSQIQSMLEEYRIYAKGSGTERKFIHWLFLIYLGRRPDLSPVPEEPPSLHAEVLKLLGSRVNESRYTGAAGRGTSLSETS